MKRIIMAVGMVALLAGGFPARAQEPSRQALAEELLDAMKMSDSILKSLTMMKRSAPGALGQAAAKPGADEEMKALAAEIDWPGLKKDFAAVYAEVFTADEIKGLIAFYKSPVGQTLIAKQPELAQRSMPINQKMMMKVMPKLSSPAAGQSPPPGAMRSMQQIMDGDLSSLTNETERFYALGQAAKKALDAGKKDLAKKYAGELAALADRFKTDWNYGNAIQDSNIVLGRLALAEGRIDEAKKRLIAAGNSPGSPQMNSFGPNVSLAKDLLEKGEKEVVLEYFKLCAKFWHLGDDKLREWADAVNAGKTPHFGANMFF